MKLDDLKKSLSDLDKVLDKINSEISVDVDTCQTAQSRLVKKFRQIIVFSLIFVLAYAVLIAKDFAPSKFPFILNIMVEIYALFAAIWYGFLYLWLRRINIATISPSKLFEKTARLKFFLISGEIVFLIAFCLMFLSYPSARWYIPGTLIGATIVIVFHTYPKYKEIFRDLNSIK